MQLEYKMSFTLIGLLTMLVPIHIYWFSLIVRMIWRMIANKSSVEKDIRSDDEDEEPVKKSQ